MGCEVGLGLLGKGKGVEFFDRVGMVVEVRMVWESVRAFGKRSG